MKNNKGMTIIEIVITFALLMFIIGGLFTLILNSREITSMDSLYKSYSEYNSQLIKVIQGDFIENDVNNVSSCSLTEAEEDYISCAVFSFDSCADKEFRVDILNKEITYDGIKYEIPNQDKMEFLDERALPGAEVEAYFPTGDGLFPVEIEKTDNIINIKIPYFEQKLENYTEGDYVSFNKERENLGFEITHVIGLEDNDPAHALSSLDCFTIENHMEIIDYNTSSCGTDVYIPANNEITTIASGAFEDKEITSVRISSNIINIGANAIRKEIDGSNKDLVFIINLTGQSFDWSSITGSTTSGQSFVTGTIIHQAGNINVIEQDDVTAPTCNVNMVKEDSSSYTEDTWSNQAVTVTWDCSDNVGGSGIDGDAHVVQTFDTEGEFTATMTVKDNYGNQNSYSKIVKVDTQAPSNVVLNLSGATSGVWTKGPIPTSISYTENGSGVDKFQYYYSGEWHDDVDGLGNFSADRNETVKARVIDNAGNVSTDDSKVLMIDATGPVVSSVTGGSTSWTTGSRTLVVNATDAGCGIDHYEYYYSDSWHDDADGSVTFSADRDEVIECRAVDILGNVGEYLTGTVKIDATKPVVSSVTGGSTSWTAGSRTLTINATDATSGISTYQFYYSGAWHDDSNGILTFNATRNESVEGRAIDNAGNVSDYKAGTVKIDHTNPTISFGGYDYASGSCSNTKTEPGSKLYFETADAHSGPSYLSIVDNSGDTGYRDTSLKLHIYLVSQSCYRWVQGTATDNVGNSVTIKRYYNVNY